MAVGYASPEDVVNAALRACGYPRAVADLYEGSRASRVALEVYGPARDALIQSQDWDFGYREIALTPTAGGAPVLGFTRQYNYPADCLRLRYVRGALASPNNDPKPNRWITANDNTLNPAVKTICTNTTAAVACYVGQVVDPTTWNPAFTQALVALLARIFAFALRDDINLSRTRAGMADQAAMEAANIGDAVPPVLPDLMARASAAARQPQQ